MCCFFYAIVSPLSIGTISAILSKIKIHTFTYKEEDRMGLLRTILIIAIVYYIIRFLGRVVLPWFLGKQMSKMTGQNYQRRANFNHKEKEGKVTIQKKQATQKMTSSDMGEYVDFEEVK